MKRTEIQILIIGFTVHDDMVHKSRLCDLSPSIYGRRLENIIKNIVCIYVKHRIQDRK